jgi:hypothetical protein
VPSTHGTRFGSDDEVTEEMTVRTKFKPVQEEYRCFGWCKADEADGDNGEK